MFERAQFHFFDERTHDFQVFPHELVEFRVRVLEKSRQIVGDRRQTAQNRLANRDIRVPDQRKQPVYQRLQLLRRESPRGEVLESADRGVFARNLLRIQVFLKDLLDFVEF